MKWTKPAVKAREMLLRRIKQMNMTGLSPEMDTPYWLQGTGHAQRRKNGFFCCKRMEEVTRPKASCRENTLA